MLRTLASTLIVFLFCSGRIRTLVVMATYRFHRFLIGKVEIDDFSCLNGDIWNLFLQKCLLSSPLRCICLLSKWLNLVASQGNKKGKF